MADSNLTDPNNNLAPRVYEPSDTQLARVDQTQRFTRLYIYLPLTIVAAIFSSIVLYLLYLALFQPSEEMYVFLSGLADFILIMWLIPTVAIFGLILAAGVGGTIYYKYFSDEESRPLPPAPPYGRLRTLLWRIDFLLVRIQPKLNEATARIARPFIRFNAWLAYIEAWIKSWWK